jgi:hypothetical protein
VRRAILLTVGAAVVAGVAAGLARDARSIQPGLARVLLLGLCVFLVFEWAAHFVGSRIWGRRLARADRAAWAALSSAGIWIALLAMVPYIVNALGCSPAGIAGMLLNVVAVAGALGVRLWFMREIYEVELDRAALIWVASRGAAVVLVVAMVTLYVVAGAAVSPHTLSMRP